MSQTSLSRTFRRSLELKIWTESSGGTGRILNEDISNKYGVSGASVKDLLETYTVSGTLFPLPAHFAGLASPSLQHML